MPTSLSFIIIVGLDLQKKVVMSRQQQEGNRRKRKRGRERGRWMEQTNKRVGKEERRREKGMMEDK